MTKSSTLQLLKMYRLLQNTFQTLSINAEETYPYWKLENSSRNKWLDGGKIRIENFLYTHNHFLYFILKV